jgi:hypothetical protein
MAWSPWLAVWMTALLLMPATGASRTPDLAREQRMAAEIVDAILDGEPVELETAQGVRFLGIYTESAMQPATGTLVILHGRGFHPDWADVVQPLRVGLIEHGWNTLSIQLPVLAKEAKYLDYVEVFPAAVPRIEAALAAARERGNGKVVMVAHSCGAHMAQHWLLEGGASASGAIDAFVGIGMGATDYGQAMAEPFVFDRLSIPVLDVYAERDFPAVRRLAPQRWALMKQGGHADNAQIEIPDAEHYFVDRGEALVEAIAAWLNQL